MNKNKIKGFSITGLMQIGCIIVVVCSVLPFLAEVFWYFDLLSSFRFQYWILSIIFLAGFVWIKQQIYMFIAALCLVLNGYIVVPLFMGGPDELQNNNHSIKLFFANVYTANQQHDELIQQVLTEDADVVFLQEVNARWQTALNSIKTEYPHSIEVPREDNFGIAVYSQTPIISHQIHDWTMLDIPSVEFEIQRNGQIIHAITTHPPPPINRYYYEAGQQQFEAITTIIKNQSNPSIVIGDLNTTVWSKHYPILTTDTGLTNASAGQGYLPTWPTKLLPMMIPIDHCLVSEHFAVIDFNTGGGIGSDHWPLIVELGF